jgi:hypothetical protein
MSRKFEFDETKPFVEKLKAVVDEGVSPEKIETFTPFYVHGVEEILKKKTSPLRFFTLFGALFGLIFGFWFTSWTSLDWRIIVGGKPYVAIPPYVIIAFELTVLFGGVISLLGFLFLSRLPSLKKIISPKEYGNKFVIIIHDGEEE